MSGLRAPVIVGVAGGVGTSTLASALHAVDGGRVGAGSRPDVLVCRADSLHLAERGVAQVLVVVADRAPRLDRVGAGTTVVVVPDVAAWHGLDAPEVAGLLALAPAHRPARLAAYIAALLDVAAALVRSGVLAHPAAPARPVPLVLPAPARPPAVPLPAAPLPAVPLPVVPLPVVPLPVVPLPVVSLPSRPAAPALVVIAGGRPVAPPVPVVDRALWRGLRAVQRTPAEPAAPAAGSEPDDDALEPTRAG
ncbi:hypothetical protein [Pseudonocardia broussonetiae]|uniref:Uncharacterized protein n=1 Tax=Pseudonocardia broussonetiae TaxID=2736640 RepID=A0A6M6JCE5_9PSEU|nr:hypothetical protein [Pseudonocardia broussonetiae]QJY45236.1 hypothetical protein HOP40_04845 [Pseudonocardia broussonetiae]